MHKLVDHWFRLLNLLVVGCMVAMVFMVFGNVVLRYCFIWLTYIGAMIAMREKSHLGVDTLIKHLGRGGKKACLFISESLMLWCNLLLILGTWKMHELQVTNVSPVVGISMIWIYGIGYVVGVVMALFNLHVLWRIVSGRIGDDELVQVRESEDTVTVDAPGGGRA